ncbi:hypothetical protein GOODEAATRI_012024, partial [Goodea atripinnis]
SKEDVCLGCSTLLPLNHTQGLNFVQASLTKLNNVTQNLTYALLEVGRMSTQMPIVDANTTGAALPPQVHVHLGSVSHKHGFGHHKLTAHHNPHTSGYLSAESAESAEVVPVAPALTIPAAEPASAAPPAGDSSSDASASMEVPITVVKREAPIVASASAAKKDHIAPVQVCPGRIRFF